MYDVKNNPQEMDEKISMNDLKALFEKFQNAVQSERDHKIRLESEIRTLQAEYDNTVKEILRLTGAGNLEEAIQTFESQKAEHEKQKVKLSEELKQYLLTYEGT